MKLSIALLTTSFFSSATLAVASEQNFNDKLLAVQHQWAQANYEIKDDQQGKTFEQLAEKAQGLTIEYPQRAESWVWHGIIQSSYANVKGGLGALSLIDNAKAAFEAAISINGQALDGSAHTSLGILYLKVPGWPISFGDEDDAEKHLKMAHAINPKGIDVNFFLAQLYVEQKQWLDAKKHLLIAQKAPKRTLRPLADKYRQQEVLSLLTQIESKLN